MEKNLLLEMYKTMVKIRLFEERVIQLFQAGELPGWLHLYIGQEAVATGVCSNLNRNDLIASTHRGHGHCIAKGVDIKYMMAELYAKKTGCCKGRGGSMHICDSSVGVLGANGIVGGGIPIATGAAMGCDYLGDKRIVVSFFGDGASNQGSFHESLNLASVWNLPIIYVCENNFYAYTTPSRDHQNIKDIAVRAKSYGIPGIIVNGMDLLDVYSKIKDIVNDVRSGKGPVLVEAKTYRYRGHSEGDPQVYRTKEEIQDWRNKDPITAFAKEILRNNIIESELLNIKEEVTKEIEEAVEFARKSPLPLKEEALDYIYSSK
jgi:acetoin:2,6-dichlorophenolindophenol oxidoreductase subunit alpha